MKSRMARRPQGQRAVPVADQTRPSIASSRMVPPSIQPPSATSSGMTRVVGRARSPYGSTIASVTASRSFFFDSAVRVPAGTLRLTRAGQRAAGEDRGCSMPTRW
jgi:hypothetical protein